MELEKLKNLAKAKKAGTFRTLEWEKTLTNKEVVKTTKATSLMLGIRYSNTKYAKANYPLNEKGQAIVNSLPWGEWLKGEEKYFIGHKGNTYLRVYTTNNTKYESKYYHNGQEITKEMAELLSPKDFKPNDKEIKLFTLGTEKIKNIK